MPNIITFPTERTKKEQLKHAVARLEMLLRLHRLSDRKTQIHFRRDQVAR